MLSILSLTKSLFFDAVTNTSTSLFAVITDIFVLFAADSIYSLAIAFPLSIQFSSLFIPNILAELSITIIKSVYSLPKNLINGFIRANIINNAINIWRNNIIFFFNFSKGLLTSSVLYISCQNINDDTERSSDFSFKIYNKIKKGMVTKKNNGHIFKKLINFLLTLKVYD